MQQSAVYGNKILADTPNTEVICENVSAKRNSRKWIGPQLNEHQRGFKSLVVANKQFSECGR